MRTLFEQESKDLNSLYLSDEPRNKHDFDRG